MNWITTELMREIEGGCDDIARAELLTALVANAARPEKVLQRKGKFSILELRCQFDGGIISPSWNEDLVTSLDLPIFTGRK